jgi:hypothetical protein
MTSPKVSPAKVMTIAVADVVFREDLYPRLEKSAATVQKYFDDGIERLDPIELNQHNELIDGWHRWTAHRKAEAKTIRFFRTETKSDLEFREIAAERNSKHGQQMSQDDKRAWVRKQHAMTPERDRDARMKRRWANRLSVGERTVDRWLEDADRNAKESRDRRIVAAWLACGTMDEIAENENVAKSVVSEVCSDFATWRKTDNSLRNAAEFVDYDAEGSDRRLYNVWLEKDRNFEARRIDNLLYGYTKPFDIVIDPFGSGATISICKKRLRRYWASSRDPAIELEGEVRRHDLLTDGLPAVPRWTDAKLVYLNPPEKLRLRESFAKSMAIVVNAFAKKLKPDAVIALVLEPRMERDAEDRGKHTDHLPDMVRLVTLPIIMRMVCIRDPRECSTPEMVEWARRKRELLPITRDIVIWRC